MEPINFDESSKAWRQNKQQRFGESSFRYVCGYLEKRGDKIFICKNTPHHHKRGVRSNKKYVPKDGELETKWSWGPCTKHLNANF